IIGPPRAPPKVLRFRAGRSLPTRLLKKSLAVKAVSRLYSKRAPRKLLLPDFVTREICAPEDRPSEAFGLVVVTRNYSIASPFKRRTVPALGESEKPFRASEPAPPFGLPT